MTMALDDIPLMSMLKSRLGYLSQQQRAIAVNVANSDTPGFVPTTLKTFGYTAPPSKTIAAPAGTLALTPVQTNAAHLAGQGRPVGPDLEGPGRAGFRGPPGWQPGGAGRADDEDEPDARRL